MIFIDEIDAVRSLPFSTDEFFAAIRECYNRRTEDPEFERLTFCLLGVATPSDLIQDTRTTPFNIGRRIELTDFTEAEAAPLAAGLLRTRISPAGRVPRPEHGGGKGVGRLGLLQRILYWTGRPPLSHPAPLPGRRRGSPPPPSAIRSPEPAIGGSALRGAVPLAAGAGAGRQPALRAGAAAPQRTEAAASIWPVCSICTARCSGAAAARAVRGARR